MSIGPVMGIDANVSKARMATFTVGSGACSMARIEGCESPCVKPDRIADQFGPAFCPFQPSFELPVAYGSRRGEHSHGRTRPEPCPDCPCHHVRHRLTIRRRIT